MNVVNLETRAIIEEAISLYGADYEADDASADELSLWEFDMTTESAGASGDAKRSCPGLTALGADQTATPVTGMKTISKVRVWTSKDKCYIPDLDVEDSDSDEDMDDADEDEEMEDAAGMGPCYHMLFYIVDS
ncbi:uncharacterized protein N7483_013172 [Penicillium malachiteum]|uniref:uncharacterized protein n=1 Tax=Penicillium malachiteum TaxID=1324776 RepID=UPI0025472274|nr:uncharacterized protein N7483_013172 [Penicillium malachiteum]KAJ5715991.1 hypothetical protein N7483_013172 [Penicillium malachiteum]